MTIMIITREEHKKLITTPASINRSLSNPPSIRATVNTKKPTPSEPKKAKSGLIVPKSRIPIEPPRAAPDAEPSV